MKREVFLVGVFLLTASSAFGQTEVSNKKLPMETESFTASTGLVEQQQSTSVVPPEDPKPKELVPPDGPAPCPLGIGKPCALLGGRLYFRDPFHMTQHDATWAQAMKNRLLITGEIFNLASDIADIEATQACLHAHTCVEGNPIFGKHPSRAVAYGISMPINFAVYSMCGWLKAKGKGNYAFGVLWGGTSAHTYFAASGAAIASETSNQTPSSGAKAYRGTISFRF